MKRALLWGLVVTFAGCVQSTGGRLVDFNMTASGPSDAVKGQPYAFTTPTGFDVTLTSAHLFIGAVYLNQTNPANYSAETACILPGIYSGEVKGSLVVDLLDPAPQPFPVKGVGTDAVTRAGELWLTAQDVNADEDRTVIFEVAGVATKGAVSVPFTAQFTIGQNRRTPPANPALPGSNPLCKQRIVSPIAANLTLAENGTLNVRVDPRAYFTNVDFSTLHQSPTDPKAFVFFNGTTDGDLGPADVALYDALRATTGPYEFTWAAPTP